MQAAGMLRGTGAAAVTVYLLGTLLLAFIGDNAHALPLQVLPNIPGYIPVYIRLGDQPLRDINPALAEAFHEKEVRENTPPEHLDGGYENSEKILENNPSYEDVDEEDDGLNVGSRRKDETIYLIGVRQTTGDKSSSNDVAPKIALPFEILERDAVARSEDGQDRGEAEEDSRIGEPDESHGRKPIALAKQAVIKVGGFPVDVKDLEKLATEVENDETRPNDIYDSPSVNDRDESDHRSESHIGKVSVRRPVSEQPISANPRAEMMHDANTDENVSNEDTRIIRPVEDPKESRSSGSMPSEPLLRPARDPKESRPDDETTDFMEEDE